MANFSKDFLLERGNFKKWLLKGLETGEGEAGKTTNKALDGEVVKPGTDAFRASEKATEVNPGRSTGPGGPTSAAEIEAARKNASKDLVPVEPEKSGIGKKIAGAAIVGGAVAAPWILGGDDKDKASSNDGEVGNPAGDENPGQENSVPTDVKPKDETKTDEPAKPKGEFQFTDAEKQGKVSVDRLKAWAAHVGIDNADKATWKDYGRNFMNDAGKEGGTLTMRNSPAPSESQKKGQAAVKKAYGLGENFLAAFDKVVYSQHPNIFQEAKKEKKADKDYDGDGKVESAKDEVWGSRMKAAKAAGKFRGKLDD